MKKKWVRLTAGVFLFISCNNSVNSDRKAEKTYSDSLMDEVMEDHNIGMAKMSKISEAQKRVQQAIDSISKLPANLQKSTTAYKIQLDSTLNRLKYADYAMNKWMEEFNMDSANENEEKRIEYLKSEKIKISKVKDAMLGSLKSTDSLLKN
jgi:hypothetical protein